MEHIFDSINPTNWFTTTNSIIAGLTPLIVILLGIMLGFFIIDSIINIIKLDKNKKENDPEYLTEDDFLYDDFPY